MSELHCIAFWYLVSAMMMNRVQLSPDLPNLAGPPCSAADFGNLSWGQREHRSSEMGMTMSREKVSYFENNAISDRYEHS
jgi:hypothetical protein